MSSISEVNPFISSDSSSTLVGSESDLDQFDSDITISDSERTETASESGMADMPINATEIIQNFQQFNSLPEVLNNIILFPQSGKNFKFLNQLEPSMSVWTHDCKCLEEIQETLQELKIPAAMVYNAKTEKMER